MFGKFECLKYIKEWSSNTVLPVQNLSACVRKGVVLYYWNWNSN